jgi:hypothetical protein
MPVWLASRASTAACVSPQARVNCNVPHRTPEHVQVQQEGDVPLNDVVDDGPSPLKYSFHNCTHLMLTQITERVRVAVIAGGPLPEAALSLSSARTVVHALQTQPFAEQQQQLEEYLCSVCFKLPPRLATTVRT